MASSSSPAYNPQLMFIGSQCHLESCAQADFLPVTCPHCKHTYCGEHFSVSSHRCSQGLAAEREADVRRPLCPLCDVAIPWTRGEDAGVALEKHLSPKWIAGRWDTECEALMEDGTRREVKKDRGPTCSERKCTKRLFVDIVCPGCKASFCPAHRSPGSHSCTASRTSSPLPSSVSSKASAAAVKRQQQQQVPPEPSRMTKSDSTNKLEAKAAQAKAKAQSAGTGIASSLGIHTKVEKRATAEQKSLFKALQHKQKLGILNETEKVKLASMMAHEESSRRKSESGDKDCVIV